MTGRVPDRFNTKLMIARKVDIERGRGREVEREQEIGRDR